MSADCLIMWNRNWRNASAEEVGSSLSNGEEITNLFWGQKLDICATGVAHPRFVNLQRRFKRIDKSDSRSKTYFVDE